MRWKTWLGASVLAAGTAGCTLITAGEFEERAPEFRCGNDPSSARRDLVLSLVGMSAHASNTVIGDLVDVGQGPLGVRRQAAQFQYFPLGQADVEVVLPCAIEAGKTYEVDLIADFNSNGMVDFCTGTRPPLDCADHQWRLQVGEDGTLTYRHSTDFTDLTQQARLPRGGMLGPTGVSGALPFRIEFDSMEPFMGHRLQVQVRRVEGDVAEQTVLSVHAPSITLPQARFESAVLVSLNEEFEVFVWIDTNDNGVYDEPSEDVPGRDYSTVLDALAEPRAGAVVTFNGSMPPRAAAVRF